MKTRIKGDSLRFRLTQSEVRALENGGRVTDLVTFSPSDKLEFSVEPWHLSIFNISFGESVVTVQIPSTVLQGWELDEREGLYETVDNGGEGLKLSIEKDFSCLKQRVGEDESDNFPNPLEGKEKC
ncbi:MAG: hypothetical protein RL220_227 [Bacteroidota bacterium]|jgi:hypothetical protein